MTNKRKLILRLRRQVRVQRSFDVESLADGREKQTCRECKTSVIVRILPEGVPVKFLARRSKYRASGSGVLGVCKTCSRRRAAERYPLPDEEAPSPSRRTTKHLP